MRGREQAGRVKACPACGRLYPDDAGFCPAEGTELTSATQVPVAADEQDARVGQLLGERYQIRRVVADGGMGRVYEALDLAERRSVALKILHPGVAADPIAVARFRREFELSQTLPHEWIAEVLDFQPTPDGTFVLVMEFLYGEELRSTLKREKTLAPARVVRMLSQVALGLDPVHARGFVHRDLKPDNLFLGQTTDGDNVKILDFGSVKNTDKDAGKLTVLGTTIGSPYYMSPEQAQGLDTLDPRADVWALAAIAYECISSQVPFHGPNGPSTLLQILTAEPLPPSRAGASLKYPIPESVDRALWQAFRKNPQDRTPSVGALADAVGGAYGLEGTHRDWVTWREEEIARRIDARLPEILQASSRDPSEASQEFFGGHDWLGSDEPGAPTQPARFRLERDESSPVPMRARSELLLPIIVLGVLFVGGLVLAFWTLLD